MFKSELPYSKPYEYGSVMDVLNVLGGQGKQGSESPWEMACSVELCLLTFAANTGLSAYDTGRQI